MATSVLSLDLATKAGFAFASPVAFRDWPLASLPLEQRVGPVDGVEFGTQDFGADQGGRFFANLSNWIADLATDYQPRVIVFERPILFRNQAAIRKAAGGAAVCELIAYRRDMRTLDANPSQWKKAFTGKGNAKKPEIMTECLRRGWLVEDDNAADALGLLDYAINWMHEGEALAA